MHGDFVAKTPADFVIRRFCEIGRRSRPLPKASSCDNRLCALESPRGWLAAFVHFAGDVRLASAAITWS